MLTNIIKRKTVVTEPCNKARQCNMSNKETPLCNPWAEHQWVAKRVILPNKVQGQKAVIKQSTAPFQSQQPYTPKHCKNIALPQNLCLFMRAETCKVS